MADLWLEWSLSRVIGQIISGGWRHGNVENPSLGSKSFPRSFSSPCLEFRRPNEEQPRQRSDDASSTDWLQWILFDHRGEEESSGEHQWHPPAKGIACPTEFDPMDVERYDRGSDDKHVHTATSMAKSPRSRCSTVRHCSTCFRTPLSLSLCLLLH